MDLAPHMKAMSLLALVGVLLPVQAQEERPGVAPVRVSIQRFSSEGSPPELDALRSILPNLLQASLFQFEWLSAEVSADGAQPANPAGASAENRFVVRGQYTQLGEKIRVDVIVTNSSDGRDVTGDFAMFAPEDMVSEMQKLALRCAQAIAPSRQPSTPTGPGVLVSAFTGPKTQDKLSYLTGLIPRAIVRAADGADLGKVALSTAANERSQWRFSVSGSFQALGDHIRVEVRVADRSGDGLTFQVESTDKLGFSLPQTVAGRVLEVLRGLTEQSASQDPAFDPKPADPAACRFAADLARSQGKLNLAIMLYRRAQRGGGPLAALHLIGIYREQHATDAALSEAQMLATTANSPRTYFSRGLVHLLDSEFKDAIEAFIKTSTSNIEPELRPYVYAAAGNAHLSLADLAGNAQAALAEASEAVANYQRALDAGASDASIYRSFARACNKAGQPVKAIDALEKVRAREPADLQIREDLASLYRDQGIRLYDEDKFPDALSWLDKALGLNPSTQSVVSDAATHQASILAFHSDPPKNDMAIDLLQIAAKADPKNEWALRQLAILNRTVAENLARLGRQDSAAQKYDDAVRNFQAAIATGINYPDYWGLADTYMDMNQIDLAIGTLQKAIGVGGSNVKESYGRLAQVYTAHGDTDLALSALESAKKLDPNDEWIWRVQADTLRKAARYEDSIQAGEQALKLRITCSAYWGLALTYESQKHFPEAMEMYRKALSPPGACSAAARGMASTLAREGKETEAVEALGKLLGPDPKPNGDYWAVTEVYGLLKKPERARAQLEPLLRKFPDSPDLLGAMAHLYHEYLFEFEAAYQINRKEQESKPFDIVAKGNLAENAVTAGHYDEALQLAAAIQDEKATSLQYRFVMRIVTSMALLGKHDYARAQLEVGRFISDYRATRADWDRTWLFWGSRHYVSQSPNFAAIDRELLNLMFTAMEQNRPKSDEVVNQIESLVTSNRFRGQR